jgi:hypothetical protein
LEKSMSTAAAAAALPKAKLTSKPNRDKMGLLNQVMTLARGWLEESVFV